MNNKPQYTLFKNASYALDGFVHAVKTEMSFKLELFFFIPIMIAIYWVPFALTYKLVLIMSFVLIMIVELLNSAVENVVDLVTQDIHPLAKSAKDIGATAVLFSLLLHLCCWVMIVLDYFSLL